jgi:integrase
VGPQWVRSGSAKSRRGNQTMKLTQRRIEALECPPGKKDILVFDDEQAGLGCRVTSGGGKSFLAQYRHAGEKRRIPLGSCSAISLADARIAARAIMGEAARGGDPATERKRKAANDALTVEALLEQWEALHLADRRERYRAEAVRALRIAFTNQLKTPAAELSRSAVVRVLDSMAKAGKTAMASRTAAYGQAAYGWAMKRGSIETSPFVNLPKAPVTRRERVLTDEELRAVWQATEEPGAFNRVVRLLLLTAQRREEVAGATWGEIAADLSAWTIPSARAKNGAAHLVPLSREAQAILSAAARGDGSSLIFPGERGVFSGWSKSKDRLDQRSGVTGWTLHDLRRTAATGLQKLGVRIETTEAILNHVSGSRAGIAGVYQRYDWAAEKRTALSAWGAHVAAIVEGRAQEGNVTPIRARAGAL